MAVPLTFAATSPLLAWRDPIYIIAGFAGVLAMVLLLLQPLLAGKRLSGIYPKHARTLHQMIGGLIVGAVLVHLIGLWITSPPDVVDALLFRSPTGFSVWGVIAMWALLGSALIAIFRKRLRVRPKVWLRIHTALGCVIVTGTILHSLLIQGTMEPISKILLSAILAFVTIFVVLRQNAGSRQNP
ncbi:MAG: ferric reductase-like transmembrane domain-containing protein [Sulfitobacter sp.]